MCFDHKNEVSSHRPANLGFYPGRFQSRKPAEEKSGAGEWRLGYDWSFQATLMSRRTGGSVNVSLLDSSMFSAESYPQSSAEQMVFARGTRFTKEIKTKQIKIFFPLWSSSVVCFDFLSVDFCSHPDQWSLFKKALTLCCTCKKVKRSKGVKLKEENNLKEQQINCNKFTAIVTTSSLSADSDSKVHHYILLFFLTGWCLNRKMLQNL